MRRGLIGRASRGFQEQDKLQEAEPLQRELVQASERILGQEARPPAC